MKKSKNGKVSIVNISISIVPCCVKIDKFDSLFVNVGDCLLKCLITIIDCLNYLLSYKINETYLVS